MRLEYFQMIDHVEAFDADKRHLRARAVVPEAGATPVFEGHFPGLPIVPGVLLLETMAQASGYLLLGLNRLTRMPFFAGSKQAKFREFVKPETVLIVTADVLHEGSGFAVTKAEIRVDGRRICDAELTFRIVEFPAPELDAAMRAQVARAGLAALIAA